MIRSDDDDVERVSCDLLLVTPDPVWDRTTVQVTPAQRGEAACVTTEPTVAPQPIKSPELSDGRPLGLAGAQLPPKSTVNLEPSLIYS